MGRRPPTENVLPLLVLVLALFKAVVDRPGLSVDQIVEAAAVERQILHFALAHEARNRGGGGIDHGNILGNGDLLKILSDLEPYIHHRFFADDQIDACADRGPEARFLHGQFQRTQGHRENPVIPGIVGGRGPSCSRFETLHGYRGAAGSRAGGVFHLARDCRGNLSGCGSGGEKNGSGNGAQGGQQCLWKAHGQLGRQVTVSADSA